MASLSPLVLTVGSGVLYHLALRGGGGGGSNPWAFLTLAYAVAFGLSASAWGASGGGLPPIDRRVVVGAVLLGAAAIGIEVGYYLGYRSGWAIGQASLVNAGIVAAVLALIGAMERRVW
ncbi:MAG TPA: hypothetical protein VM261_23100 [Kofleriaceae bacterium]|nr:hypothetical protein [Kofleriaceae bacterium]